MGKYVVYELDKEAKVATIMFNKPEKLNCVTPEDIQELTDTVSQAAEDPVTKVIIFKGAGRCFGAGMEVGRIGAEHGTSGSPRPNVRDRLRGDSMGWGVRSWQSVILRVPKVTIAQVQGYAYGFHLHMVAACDIVIASEDAQFTHPGFRYIGPMGPIALYILYMGLRKAKEMMLTGSPLSAREALECGLINRVVPADKLEEEVNKMASLIALQPYDALAMGKANIELALDILGVAAQSTAAYIGHTLQTRIHYEPGEFNLLRERSHGGVKGAIRKRETHYEGAGLAKPKG